MRHIISSHGVPDDKASDAAELAFDCLRWLTDKMLFSDTLEIDHPLIEICRFPVCVIGHRVEAITGQQGRVEVG